MNSILLLGIPSIFVFALLAIYLYKNVGMKLTLAYFISAIGYGILRGSVLDYLIRDDFGPLFPYLMNSPALRIGIVSVQEVIGWSVAVLLSWILADRILRRIQVIPSPHRVALIAFFCMSAICWAVETAAIGAGWWTWTIKQPVHPIFGKVPLIGLLDWGFVAFDFLLPFLLFASVASLNARLISLTLFPLHFFFHPKLTVLPEPVPLTPNDLMHTGIFAYVLARSIEDKSVPLLKEPSKDRVRWFPSIALVIIVAATAAAELFVAKNPKLILGSVPLLLLGILAFALPFSMPEIRPSITQKRGEKKSEWQALYWFGIFLMFFVITYLIRVPFYRRTQQFMERVSQGIESWNRGDLRTAEDKLKEAVRIRPDQPSGHAVLAQLYLQQQRWKDARAQAEKALELNPTQRDALLLLATIDLKEMRWNESWKRASYGNSLYPDRAEFLYLRGIAEKNMDAFRQNSSQTIQLAMETARDGGLEGRRSLARLAFFFGDPDTVKALQ